MLLPYLDLRSTWERIYLDRPWDDPSMTGARQDLFLYYSLREHSDPKRQLETVLSVVTGPGTPFDPSRTNGYFNLDREAITFVEIRNSGAHWMQPWDLDLETMPPKMNAVDQPSISGNLPGGFFVVFADCTVWLLSNDTPFEHLEPFLTVEDAKENDREELLGPYRIAKYGSSVYQADDF